MKISFISPLQRRTPKLSPSEAMASDYLDRISRYAPIEVKILRSEAAFLDLIDKHQTRTPAHLILLDPRGQLLTSKDFAQHLGRLRDRGTQHTFLAIGPADGWSNDARARADLLFSLGRITLPHELARVVLAEQLYRALTILAGHPYHSGH